MSLGMPVNVQVESFNYNEWGTLPGKVTEISSDFLTDSQGNSFYKVKCQMERNYLMLKSGQKGILKKGMTSVPIYDNAAIAFRFALPKDRRLGESQTI